jgi:hypothetical protein
MVWYLVRRRIMSRMQAGRCEGSRRVSNRVKWRVVTEGGEEEWRAKNENLNFEGRMIE